MSGKSVTKTDVFLVGGGIMSATLGTMLAELDSSLSITMAERLDDVVGESSQAWNNAGTGHAAYCELNYTPRQDDGKVDIHRVFGINARFEVNLQYWSYLVKKGLVHDPAKFINPVPHVSFVWGNEHVAFLRERWERMTEHLMFSDMAYSEDADEIREWIPLVMKGRDPAMKVAATRVPYGTDVNFGAIARAMIDHLEQQPGFELLCGHEVRAIDQMDNGRWRIIVRETGTGAERMVDAGFVFVGAGGGALELLQKARVSAVRGYGGFPVSGRWLICKNPDVARAHWAKVYGMAPVGAPPMSVPHLDTRIIDGERKLLFGPFAGFTTRFLRHGSLTDLFRTLNTGNLKPMLSVGVRNLDLTRYLVRESFQGTHQHMESLRRFFPEAEEKDWELREAGKRVQIIKPCKRQGGKLEFGTEVMTADDRSLAGLLGASPGASIIVPIALEVIEKCFTKRLATEAWQRNVRRIIPSYGVSIVTHKDRLAAIREDTLTTLKLDTHWSGAEHLPADAEQPEHQCG
jgi:malate dehydrogenase (quinone)